MNIHRSKMPQIQGQHFKDFSKWLDKEGISYKIDKVDAKKLHASQEMIHYDKVDTIIKMGLKDGRPVLVSSDMFVLDGHHRVFAHRILKKPINSMVIDMPIKALLEKLKKYDKTTYYKK